jgi:uncharacterized membrane protein YtjA (UPF0391 family)
MNAAQLFHDFSLAVQSLFSPSLHHLALSVTTGRHPRVAGATARGTDVASYKGKEVAMLLKWAAIFFVIALIAAAFGFSGIAMGAASIAKILFFLFLAIFAVLLIAGLIVGGKAFS